MFNLKILFYKLPVTFYELKVNGGKITSLKFKVIMFTSCEVVRLNIYDANFTNYNYKVESNFKAINLCKLWEKAILIKCNLTLDNSNTHWPNAIETVI